MRRDSFEQELSFHQAARKLNRRGDSRGRGLRAMVLAREKQTGKQIAIRLNGPKQPKLRITVGALYRAFPELLPARIDDIHRLMAPMLERQAAKHAESTRKVLREELEKDIGPRVERLEKQTRIIHRALTELGKV